MKNLTPVKSVRNKLKKIQIQIEQDEAQPEGKQSTDLRIKKTQVCAKKTSIIDKFVFSILPYREHLSK